MPPVADNPPIAIVAVTSCTSFLGYLVIDTNGKVEEFFPGRYEDAEGLAKLVGRDKAELLPPTDPCPDWAPTPDSQVL